jgi:acetylornithine deacetylase/succinyl-diaminopimelate desuccinylase-like protein
MDALTAHLRAHCPPGLTLELSDVRSGSRGFRLPVDSPLIRLATDVLTRIDPRGPLFLWEGASIPIIATLQEVSGAAPLLVGFGREEDRIHAPNESFGLDQFQQVMTYADAMLGALV